MHKIVQHKRILAGAVIWVMLLCGGIAGAQTTSVGFRISNLSIAEKDTFVVSLSADSLLTGKGIYAYRFYLSYSPAYFEFIGLEGTGNILADWGTPALNGSNPGTLVMAGAGSAPLSGSGQMILLKFRSMRSGNATISFNTSESYLNEGNPPAQFVNGVISASARSYPNIYPDQAQLFVGDEVQMNVSGGLPPYVYSVENTGVALITDVDRVRAIAPGTTRVMVTDGNQEVSYTTSVFDVRAINLDLEEVNAWPEDTFYIPVRISVKPGTTIYSGRFDLAFNTGISGITGDILPGDFTIISESRATSGRMTMSFASPGGFSGDGILFYVGFRANSSGNMYVRFENMRFNETLLSWATKANFYILVNSLPTLNISPNSGILMWGDVMKINVSNGTAPYTYKVSDTAIASIDNQGNLTSITGGKVTVTVTDFHGATRTSGQYTVSDNRMSIYPSDGTLDSETRVPVISSPLPDGKLIFGYDARFTFEDNYLEFVRADPPSGGGLVHSSLSGNTIRVAGASADGIPSGVVGFLVFRIKSTLPLDGRANVSFTSFAANENTLLSTLENGNVHRVEQTSYRPVAIAGKDFSVKEGSSAMLDGSGSFDLDGGTLSYKWIVPANFVIDDATLVTPEIIVPYVPENTSYPIKLLVNDGEADSDTSILIVTVLQVNHPPDADAGEDQVLVEGSSVTLNGGNSFDPDGDAISYFWTSLDGVVLFNATGQRPSCILPQVAQNTSYRFKLVVNDGAVNSSPDTVFVTSVNVNKKPVAFAGGDFTINEKEQGTLDGSLSYDADGDLFTYLWTAPPGITLSSNSIAKPVFTAPAIHRDSVLNFQLVVNDGAKNSDPDIVRVTVLNLDSLSRETLIYSVSMSGLDSSIIDTTTSSILLHVPYGTDIRSLSPDFTLSHRATINPPGGSSRDYSTPVYYTVTAEDGFESRVWRVEIVQPEAEFQRELSSGWNWISLNVKPAGSGIADLFSGLTLSDMDYIKSTEYSSTFYTATGWFGNLVSFPQNRMVKFRKSVAEQFTVSGRQVNPTITPISVVPGWNSLAYLLRSNAGLNVAFEASTLPGDNIILKGLEGSSVYYNTSGWVGEIDSLKVLHGYNLHLNSKGNIRFDPAVTFRKKSGSSGSDHKELLDEFNVKPEKYEFSATLIAEPVTLGGDNSFKAGDLVIARHEGEIRGVSSIRYISELDRNLFILTYYSNNEEEHISFWVVTGQDQEEYSTDLYLLFQPDNITGEPYTPRRMTVNVSGTSAEYNPNDQLMVYPNPVIDHLTVSHRGRIEQYSLYSPEGRVILKGNGFINGTTISFDGVTPGVYTLKLELEERVIFRKIVKTSH